MERLLCCPVLRTEPPENLAGGAETPRNPALRDQVRPPSVGDERAAVGRGHRGVVAVGGGRPIADRRSRETRGDATSGRRSRAAPCRTDRQPADRRRRRAPAVSVSVAPVTSVRQVAPASADRCTPPPRSSRNRVAGFDDTMTTSSGVREGREPARTRAAPLARTSALGGRPRRRRERAGAAPTARAFASSTRLGGASRGARRRSRDVGAIAGAACALRRLASAAGLRLAPPLRRRASGAARAAPARAPAPPGPPRSTPPSDTLHRRAVRHGDPDHERGRGRPSAGPATRAPASATAISPRAAAAASAPSPRAAPGIARSRPHVPRRPPRSRASSASSAQAASVSASRHAAPGAASARAFSVPASSRSTDASRSLFVSVTRGSSYRTIRRRFLARRRSPASARDRAARRLRTPTRSTPRSARRSARVLAQLTLDVLAQRPPASARADATRWPRAPSAAGRSRRASAPAHSSNRAADGRGCRAGRRREPAPGAAARRWRDRSGSGGSPARPSRRGGARVLVRQRLEPLLRAQAIHVALRQHGAQPRREAAASLEVAEERPALAPASGMP